MMNTFARFSRWQSVLLLCFLIAVPSLALIVEFKDFKIPVSGWDIEKQQMYSSLDTPVGHNQAYLDVDLNISSNKEGFASLLLYNYETRTHFGTNSNPKKYCCTPQLASQNQCHMGQVVVKNMTGVPAPLGVRHVSFSGNQPVAHFKYHTSINQTSTYYFVIANCPGANTEGLLLNGYVAWKNPYGYLPGGNVGLWYYYGLQTLAYLLIAVTYGVLMYLYRNQLLRIQYGILGLMVLGTLQMLCWWIYELRRNRTGLQSSGTGALVMAILFTVIKGTLSRLVVLVVCMGIGIIKWTLGATKVPVFALTGGYFISSLLYEIVETMRQVSNTQVHVFVIALVLFGVWISDTIFVWWALISVIRTMGQLTLRRQELKLNMYKRFFYIMIGCVVVWALTLIIHFFILATKDAEAIWRSNWLWFAFWHFSFFCIIAIVAVLWRPTRNNTRYGYSEVYYDDDDDIEHSKSASNEVQLHAMGSLSPVGETRTRGTKSNNGELGASSSSVSSADKDTLSFSNKFDTISAFALEDDEQMGTQIKKLD